MTIGDGSTVEVTLTNTITENPETASPETASPETPGVTPGLAITGGAGTGALVGGAVLLLLAGAALLLARRRKAHTE